MRILLVVTICFLLTACQTGDISTESRVDHHQAVNRSVDTPEGLVSYTVGDIRLSINKPAKWESFPTESGIVIGERFGSVATSGVLEGLMAYLFVTPIGDFTIDAQTNVNLAQLSLNQILSDPIYTANIAHSGTSTFKWDDYDSAYYLISGDDGNATIVIGIAIPNQRVMVSCSVSAPYAQRERIRPSLPVLLDGLKLNDITLSGKALETLPNPLEFPTYQ